MGVLLFDLFPELLNRVIVRRIGWQLEKTCRISLVIRLWLTEASTWSAGFVPRRVPLVDARRLILTSLLKRDPFGGSIGAIKGRTLSLTLSIFHNLRHN